MEKGLKNYLHCIHTLLNLINLHANLLKTLKILKMDLIVHTGGSIQNVSGVNEATTCAQIIYALAHATQQKGKFSLIAKLDSTSEHRFTPSERPLEFLRECAQQGIPPEFELRKLGDTEESQSEGSDTPNRLSANSSSTMLAELADQQKNRPPPPDYNSLMSERCNSIRRGMPRKAQSPLTFLNIPNFSLQNLYTRKFTRMDLEALVDIQEKTLAAQKTELVRVELTMLDSKERELVQLRKQQNNLQTVLNSLRNGTWPKRLNAEKAEAERLNTAIAAMRTAVAEKQRELKEALNLQKTLKKQLANELSRMELENGH